MFDTAIYALEADRFTPFSDSATVEAYDFTGAVVKMQVRDRKNGGLIRADIVPVITTIDVEGVINSVITWTIDEATMENMPTNSADPVADVELYYDIHLTPSGAPKFVILAGKFTVKAGVTE